MATAKSIAAKRNEITVDLIDKMHKEAFETARESKQAGAVTAAAQNLDKLHGLVSAKKDSNGDISIEIVRYADEGWALY